MKRHGRLIITVLALLIACALLFAERAHWQIEDACRKIPMEYDLTRAYLREHHTTGTFYFANTLPATIHANCPGNRNDTTRAWNDIVKPVKLYGTRFTRRLHVNLNEDGTVRCSYTEKEGITIPRQGDAPLEVELHNRIGEKRRFLISRDGSLQQGGGSRRAP
ncbi:MAG: hypothetical protein RDV48_14570 [Candidatus Eremiobacteraeota bacterium]|nr:hypothetical protein [Candidatus Eremiobacteraeota bacterium]